MSSILLPKFVKDFDRLFYVECRAEDLNTVEQYYIQKFSPVQNKTHSYHFISQIENQEPEPDSNITLAEFKAMEEEYQWALNQRRAAIFQMRDDGLSQKEIADYWGIDISRVNRILNKSEEK